MSPGSVPAADVLDCSLHASIPPLSPFWPGNGPQWGIANMQGRESRCKAVERSRTWRVFTPPGSVPQSHKMPCPELVRISHPGSACLVDSLGANSLQAARQWVTRQQGNTGVSCKPACPAEHRGGRLTTSASPSGPKPMQLPPLLPAVQCLGLRSCLQAQDHHSSGSDLSHCLH